MIIQFYIIKCIFIKKKEKTIYKLKMIRLRQCLEFAEKSFANNSKHLYEYRIHEKGNSFPLKQQNTTYNLKLIQLYRHQRINYKRVECIILHTRIIILEIMCNALILASPAIPITNQLQYILCKDLQAHCSKQQCPNQRLQLCSMRYNYQIS
ncbi:unnamed protein product [Paramecium octaurelia]|uniref:Uncharacterized protein n=1 Tax=Paramecium octaurelia TaxID=43137 RepID=A0A8S1YIP8_PAROT|nr:unnamed protein product [Paramecium octaurelia]